MKFNQQIMAAVIFTSLSLLFACSGKKDQDVQKGSSNNQMQQPNAKVYPVVSNEQRTGKKAADFTWMQDGKQVRFSDFTKGKFVLLNFWGTWCPPCRAEIPDLIELSREMEGKGLVVMGAALERADTEDEAVRTVADYWNIKQMYYPVVVANSGLADAYGGIEAVPTTFFINDKGEIYDMFQGMRTKADFMAKVNEMMKIKS
jgi:thiol-disulfide isomerase/thioredoxin